MRRTTCIGATLFLLIVATATMASDWPEFRFDASRGGVSPDTVPDDLAVKWTHVAAAAPAPAWPEPGRELNRLEFDYVHHAVASDGAIYYGSSADHQVHALQLSTGRERWSFFTGGPIRFAPCIAEGRLYVASDDGVLYCLDAETGVPVWQFRAGPNADKVVGNEAVTSRWPMRTGVTVVDGIAYVSAGMWPSEGIYVYALNADDGSVVWVNDSSGELYLAHPHPGSFALSGVAPQGYILVTDDQVRVPTGRSVPAAYDRETGKLLYYKPQPNTWNDRWGGSWNFIVDGLNIGWRTHHGPEINIKTGESEQWPDDGLIAIDCATGERAWELIGKLRAVVDDGIMYASGGGSVSALDFTKLAAGTAAKDCTIWSTKHDRAYSLIKSGDTIIVGGAGTVTTLAADTGEQLSRVEVDGQVRGVAVADGRVLASTTDGAIHCITRATGAPTVVRASVREADYSPEAGEQADHLIQSGAAVKGFAVALATDDLALALADRTDLTILCPMPNERSAKRLQKRAARAGLYGTGGLVAHVGALSDLNYPRLFANLVVVGDAATSSGEDAYALVRPYGGLLCLPGVSEGRADSWLDGADVPGDEIMAHSAGAIVLRGALPGADEWTHQYAHAGRTGASSDYLVKAPLHITWFGGPGPEQAINRHWKGPAPLFADGRMFITGQYSITAVDAYNGTELWFRGFEDMGGRFPVQRLGGNVATDGAFVYLATGASCLKLDAATGETVTTFELPGGKDAGDWMYLALESDLVLGTAGTQAGASILFALDAASGAVVWQYDAERSIHHDSVAIADGMVYLIDKPTEPQLQQLRRRGEEERAKGALVALYAGSGREAWRNDQGLTERIDLRCADGVLLATGGGRMTAYSATTGEMLSWGEVAMRGFPVVVDGVVYGEPYAYNLATGEPLTRTHPQTLEEVKWNFARSYGCGAVGGAPGVLMFRSAMLGYYDLAGDGGTHNFGGVRAGCYVNAIAAGGLMLMPVGDAGCTCSYSYQTTIALAPSETPSDWAAFAAAPVGASQRIRHLAVNLGAPGDRRDEDGTLWQAYPRTVGLTVPLRPDLGIDGGFYRRQTAALPIAETSAPWLYTSGIEGARGLAIDLGAGGPSEYTVVLHFAETSAAQVGERVFDVAIQGEPVVSRLDVAEETGGRAALEVTVEHVMAAETLEVTFRPDQGLAMLSAIEITEE